jgi:putative addiction module killer protein
MGEWAVYELRHFETTDGRDPLQEWLDGLRDGRAFAAVLRRIDGMASGNFGDHAFCRDGVWELRIDIGPGYRVYYALRDRTIVILLCGGDKRRQRRDIEQAVRSWRELQRGNR